MSLGAVRLTVIACGWALLATACASRGPAPSTARPQPAPEPIADGAANPRPDPLTAAVRSAPAPVAPPVPTAPPVSESELGDEPTALEEILMDTAGEPAPAELADLDALPAETVYDIDIPMNERVLRFVDLFAGRLKGYLEDGLSRGAQYLPMIQEVFRAEGLPLDLAYVPLVESAFKPSALSRAKAKGIWQFMQGTGLENGLRHDWYIDERSEPEKATRAAARYLKTLYGMFGDWHLALAAYNGGPGRVQRAMNRSSRRDFWALSASSRYLPRETRDYVPLILAAVVVARNQDRYGIDIEPADAVEAEIIHVAGAVDLRRVAEFAGVPLETLQTLNPELRRWTTPVRAAEYELKVPAGTGDQVLERMTFADPVELVPLSWYTVKKGETLLGIARKLGVTRADLAEANYLSVRARLQTGQQLIVPRPPALDGERVALDAVVASARVPEPSRTMSHLVRRGDTLYSIARRYDTTVAAVQRWNGLRGTFIRAGQRLIIRNEPASGTN